MAKFRRFAILLNLDGERGTWVIMIKKDQHKIRHHYRIEEGGRGRIDPQHEYEEEYFVQLLSHIEPDERDAEKTSIRIQGVIGGR